MKYKRMILTVLLAITAYRPLCSMNESTTVNDDELVENLKGLLYWNIVADESRKQFGQGTYAVKTGAWSDTFNTAFACPTTTETDVDDVLEFMGGVPFSWYVAQDQHDVKALLEHKGFVLNGPKYMMETKYIGPKNHEQEDGLCEYDKDNFSIRAVNNNNDLEAWKKTAAQGFDMSDKAIDEFVEYFFLKSPNWGSLCGPWLGCCNGPVSTGLAFFDNQISSKASIHLVSTIQEYRKQGFATKLMTVLLRSVATTGGFGSAILFSTPMAHKWLQATTFSSWFQWKDVATYDVYTKNVTDEVNNSTQGGVSRRGNCQIF